MQHNPTRDDFYRRTQNITKLFTFLKNNNDIEFMNYLDSLDPNEIDVNIKDEQNNFLIFFMVMNNKKQLLLKILEKGAKLDIFDTEGRSLLYYPIKFNYQEIIDILIEVDKKNIGLSLINIKDARESTPLIYAIKFSNKQVLKQLLDNGADANIKNSMHYNALHMAVKKKDVSIVNIIVKYISNINSKTKEGGATALHYACDFMLYDVVKILLDHGAQQNIPELDNNYYPIFYSVTQGDFNTTKLLIDNGANPNNEDVNGNTFVHYAIFYGNIQTIDYIFDKYSVKKTGLYSQSENITKTTDESINPNISNILGQTIVHALIENYVPEYKKYISLLIPFTNLNNQDNKGNTVMHLIIMKGLLNELRPLLEKKKINVHIKNHDGKTVLDLVKNNHWFIDLIISNYIYHLKKNPDQWTEPWQNNCSGSTIQTEYCFDEIKKHILDGKSSMPIKKNLTAIVIDEYKHIEMSTFTGSKLDLIAGMKYLTDKYSYATSIYHKNKTIPQQLAQHYESIKIEENQNQFIIQIEIIWSYQKLFLPPGFNMIITNIINKKYRFIIIPIGIILSNGHHSNVLLYDTQLKQVERFEPHGSDYPSGFNYNPDLLDDQIKKSLIDALITTGNTFEYKPPKSYIPKIGFQAYDSIDIRTNSNIGDPKGFCTLWCIWYLDYRLKYYNESSKKIVQYLLTEIKLKGLSFRSIIRNYSREITDYRDSYLKKLNKTVNDFINDRFTADDTERLINMILIEH